MKLRILVHAGESKFVATGLERNFATQGDSVDEALENFERGLLGMACLGHYCKTPLFGGLEPAPKSFQERWEKARLLKEPLKVGGPISYTIEWDSQPKEKGSTKIEAQSALCAVQ